MTSISPNQFLATPSNTTSSSATNIGEDFNTFIKLLTAQVRNQDPLTPLDSTQFVEQLATFSALEQQVQTNQKLDAIADSMIGFQEILASQWIGQPVSVETPVAPFEGDPLEFELALPNGADKAQVRVVDANGSLVYSEVIDGSTTQWRWDGTGSNKQTVAHGLYAVGVDAFQQGVHLETSAPRLLTEVTSISSDGTGYVFGTSSGLSPGISKVAPV